jgi:hypothetical protein
VIFGLSSSGTQMWTWASGGCEEVAEFRNRQHQLRPWLLAFSLLNGVDTHGCNLTYPWLNYI